MSTAIAIPGNTASTFLVHLFGSGLADDRYVVERFKARADGDIVPVLAEAPQANARRKGRRVAGAARETTTMFAFDTDYDPIAPAGDGLIAELGLDARSIRDTLADDRARRCPDREAPADER